MKNFEEFGKQYEKEITAIANAENVDAGEARQMLIYTCRQVEKGLHKVGAAMDFGRYLEAGFDYLECLADYRNAIKKAEQTAA